MIIIIIIIIIFIITFLWHLYIHTVYPMHNTVLYPGILVVKNMAILFLKGLKKYLVEF